MTRHATLTQEIAQAMRESFNGAHVHHVSERINAGTWALVSQTSVDGVAYAIISREGDCVCIEAVQGPGGTALTVSVVEAAREAGLTCEAWVFNKARARLAARAGMRLTGTVRVSGSGREQLQVRT